MKVQRPLRLAIIGGGLSGAAVAYHLAGIVPPGEVEILVIEPRAELGRGLAYSAGDPDHRLNVPDHKMSLRSDQPDHFHRWLARPGAAPLPPGSATLAGEIFAPRAVFGDYVAAQLFPLLATGRIRHLRGRVAEVAPSDPGYRLRLAEGGWIEADLLVLAASHPSPALPPELGALAGEGRLISDPLAPGALEGIGQQERVLIVGNGLTSADVVASLLRRHHLGAVHAVSRRGWRPQRHGPKQAETAADFASLPAPTALALLGRVRAAVAADAALGLTWHAVFDRLRAQGPAIWAALPLEERRRLLRHLRGLWDVHRFRIAPQTAEAGAALQARRRLTHLAARVVSASAEGAALRVELALRGSRAPLTLEVDRVILATGPAHASVISSTPVLASLAARGLIQPDPLRLGIATDLAGQAIPVEGGPDGSILVAGPLARGAVGELMGVPEVIVWAERIAREVAIRVATERASLRKRRLAAE